MRIRGSLLISPNLSQNMLMLSLLALYRDITIEQVQDCHCTAYLQLLEGGIFFVILCLMFSYTHL